MSQRVEDNPPLDVTLRDYYGVRPSVAAYVAGAPDEIQGDLFSFVSKRPNTTMSEVAKLAQGMMQSHIEMASSRGLAVPKSVYYQFEDEWFIKVLEGKDEIDEFIHAFTGEQGGDTLAIKYHIKHGGAVFGVFDSLGLPVAFIKIDPIKNLLYNVFEIVPRNVEVAQHLAGFFTDEEYKFGSPISWSMWATEVNGQQYHFGDLCEGVTTPAQLARAISTLVYNKDRFNLFRNLISLPVSHLMERTLNCLIKIVPLHKDYAAQIEDVAFVLAGIFVHHDKLRARQWAVTEAKQKNTTPFGGSNELLGQEVALPFYLMQEFNRSAYSWMIRHRKFVMEEIFELPEFLKFASHYGTKPDPKYYKNDPAGYEEALNMWAAAKEEARANWVEADNSISVILFDRTIEAYHETVRNYVDYKNVLRYMANDWKHRVIYEGYVA